MEIVGGVMEVVQIKEVISILILLIMYALSLIYAIQKIRMDRKLLLIFLGAILLRIIFSIINLYVLPDSLPHSGIDTISFEITGYHLSTGVMDISTYRWDNYPRLIYMVYLLFGRMPLVIIGINGVVSILSAINLYIILEGFVNSRKKLILLVSLFLFFPHNIIFSSVILRESLIIYFLLLSLKMYIYYSRCKKISSMFLSVIYLLAATSLHAGVIFIGVGYLLYILSDNKVVRRFDRLKKPLLIFLVVLIVGGLFLYNDLAFRKLAGYDSLESILKQVNRVSSNSGRSAYLSTLMITNLYELLLFLPLKVVYFLFSPMPWDIRNQSDMIAFLLDSMFYVYLLVGIFRNINRIDFKSEENKILICLLIGLLISVSVFALGTSNTGTALRHRSKFFPFMIFLANFPIVLRSRKRYVKYIS